MVRHYSGRSLFSREARLKRERERVVSVVSIYPDDVRENEERERSTFFFVFFPLASLHIEENKTTLLHHVTFSSNQSDVRCC